MKLREYKNRKKTGWIGWIESDTGRAIAFIRLDGTIIFDW